MFWYAVAVALIYEDVESYPDREFQILNHS